MIFYSKLEKGKIKVDKGLHKYFMTMLCLPIRIKETIYKQKTINSPSPLWVTLLNACHRYLLVHCFVLTHTKKKVRIQKALWSLALHHQRAPREPT